MFKSKTALMSAAAAAGLALSLGACSSSSEDTADASQAFCDDAANLATQVSSLKTMVTGGTATVDQIQEQRDAVNSAAQDMSDSASDLEGAVKTQIDEADQAYTSAVNAIPTDQTLKQSAPAYIAAVDYYDTSIQHNKSSANGS